MFGRVPALPLIVQMTEELSVALLGLLAGALLVIGAPILGYWQSLEPAEFLNSFAVYTQRLASLMVPLTVAAVVVTVLAAAGAWVTSSPHRVWFAVAAGLSLVVALLAPLYFSGANAALAGGAVPVESVPETLAAWRTLHWLRVGLSMAALVTALRGLRAADLVTISERSARRSPAAVAHH